MADAKLTIKDLPTAVTVAEDADLLALWDDSDNTTSQFSVADLKTSVINPLIAAEAAIRAADDVTLQNNIDLKADIDSPTLTGIPLAPTATNGTDTDQLATTAFVQDAVSSVTGAVVSVNGDTGAVVLDASSVGLGGFAGYTPATLPLSTAETAALATKEPNITGGTTSQYWRGDKTFQPTLGLPISTATQAALNAKLDLAGGTMTGALVLAADPTTSLQSSTKSYTDTKLAKYTIVYPEDYGYTGASLAADNTAMQSWIAALGPTVHGYLAAHDYQFSAALATTAQGVTIIGVNPVASRLVYKGASTTATLLKIGDPTLTNPVTSGYLKNFSIVSNTVMTAGYAAELIMWSDSYLESVFCDYLDNTGTRGLWNGFYFHGFHVVKTQNLNAITRQNGITIMGTSPSYGTNIWLHQGYSDFNAANGLLIAGGAGGVFIDQFEFLGNLGNNIHIDNSLTTQGNRELIFGAGVVCDGLQTASQHGLYINMPNSPNATICCNAFIGSSVLNGVTVVSMPTGFLSIGSNHIFNNLGDAIQVQDATTTIACAASLSLDSNGGWGINATVSTTKISFGGVAFSNTLGNFNTNSNVGGWTTYTPTCAPSAGGTGFTFTITNAKYKVHANKTVTCQGQIVITNNGAPAGSGSLAISLPFNCKNFAIGYGRENITSGSAIVGVANGASNSMVFTTYNNAYPVATSSDIKFSTTYEMA